MSHSQTSLFLQRNFLNLKLSSFGLKAAVTIEERAPLSEAINILAQRNFGCLLVTTPQEALVGIVSERDIVLHVSRAHSISKDLAVHELMTKNPQTLPLHGSLARALYYMSAGKYRHLPILGRDGKPIYMLSAKDIADQIYQRIAKPTITRGELIADESKLADFFVSTVQKLSPHAAVDILEHAPVTDALSSMRESEIGSVVVVDSLKRLRGIFTERDFIQRIAAPGRDASRTPIVDVMTASPKSILENSSISLAFSLFSEGGYRHLPVVNSREDLTGILSVRNFITALAEGIVAEIGE